MKVLVFEFLAGGGVADLHPLNETLAEFLKQGSAMLEPFCSDLLQQGHEVIVPVDPNTGVRLDSDVQTVQVDTESQICPVLCKLAANVDVIVIVAPESDGCLEGLLQTLAAWSDKLFSPDLEFVRLTGDKWRCFEHLRANEVPCPPTWKIESKDQLASFQWPANRRLVAKPVAGAGSEGVRVIESLDEVSQRANPFLLQDYVEGQAASVLAASDGKEVTLLEPGRQIFDADPIGIHVRTEFPLSDPHRGRAISLAQRVVDSLPNTRGYFGMDLVIGDRQQDDVLIEVNPRLTTSYGFLRQWNRALLDDVNRMFGSLPS